MYLVCFNITIIELVQCIIVAAPGSHHRSQAYFVHLLDGMLMPLMVEPFICKRQYCVLNTCYEHYTNLSYRDIFNDCEKKTMK